ncbi:MAG: cysteine dioxygenase [Rhodanobacter sp.]|nr:MAG: cysteine dioxygenase [Rhodanobacter sp.]TAM13940.1 MAG: cysteine dioxygenase [Rhodanobacter sp.]TAM37782.1 MAG: cysteine dioxygenase [Rhodanobacter sp.]
MGQRMHGLKTLRDIVLEYGMAAHPDLAAMARELGRVVHRNGAVIARRLNTLQRHCGVSGYWSLARQRQPALHVAVKAWPTGAPVPLCGQAGDWELELALHGALALETWRRDPLTGSLVAHGRDWLGPGDARWFEHDAALVHRCRNLSRRETAYTLHVCRSADASHRDIPGGETAGWLPPALAGPRRIAS